MIDRVLRTLVHGVSIGVVCDDALSPAVVVLPMSLPSDVYR